MTEKDQSKINNESLPELKASAPTSDTPYIEPIIGKLGYDTRPEYKGLFGLGSSKDNGINFHVSLSLDGLVFDGSDIDNIWNGTKDKVAKVVAPAKSAADSAVSAADAAVASAQVTSDAVSAIASATAEAKQGANEAMSRAESAWDVATGAKEAVTDFDPLLKSAQSGASKALTQIADTASALSDAKTAFGSDVAAAKQLANTAQTTADNAIKSASSVASDLTAVASQAKSNANGITKVTSDVGLLQTTVADNSGNISKIQETAAQIQQAVSDNAGNITTAKQTADSAVTVASDARSNATVAIQTASQASITASSASGQAASAVLTANGAQTAASDAKSNATVAVQTASGARLTATNAQSDATIAKQTASEAIVQASNAESDFAQLSIRANKIEANVATNSGAIASVQQTANGLTTTVADIKANGGGVNLLRNSTNDSGKFQPNNSRIDNYSVYVNSTVYMTQGQQYTVHADASDGLVWSSTHNTNVTNNNVVLWLTDNTKYSVIISDANTGTRTTFTWNYPSGTYYLRVNTYNPDNSGYVEKVMFEKGTVAHDWSPAPDDLQNQFTQTKESIDGVTTTINDPKTGLNATYQTAAGNATTISNVKGDVSQLQTTANGLTSRVGNLESKTDKQQTAIEQNKTAITLKADQTTVNTLKGTVDQNTATLKTQANQIQAKVSASDVTGMLNGYATQSYAQSLVTQTADRWNLNLTSLQTDVNAIKTTGGGVNLANGTSSEDQSFGDASQTTGWRSPIIATFDNPQAGQQYTVSVNAKFNGGSWRIQFWDGKTPTQWVNNVYKDVVVTQEQKYIATFTWPSGSNKYLLVLLVNHNNGGQIVWNSAMIEEGSVAHTWSPAPSDMATVTSVANLSATVDGIQSQVYNKDGSSKITQLSNLIQDKVSSGDFTSTTTQLKNLINQRVQVGNVISQINQEAGGNTLIQVSNGKKSLILDAANTIITGKAWIPSAAIESLDASKLTFYGANNTYATMGASVAQYDDDKQKSTINLQYNGGIEIHSSNQQGSILTMHDNTIRLASKSWGDNSNPYQYSGFYAAPNYSLMNTYHKDGTSSGVAIDDDRIWIYGNSKDQQLGALQADVGWYSINGKTGLLTGNQISLKAGNTQAVLTDNNININNASDTNDKNYDVGIHIKGWAEMTGWFNCMGISQTSLLSTKTRIEPLDTKVALDKIVSANVGTYQFKSDVAKGKTKRHASVIIDDVHDVAEYYTPEEFISENRMGRDDGDIIGYLMGAVQELKKQLDELKEKI